MSKAQGKFDLLVHHPFNYYSYQPSLIVFCSHHNRFTHVLPGLPDCKDDPTAHAESNSVLFPVHWQQKFREFGWIYKLERATN